MTDERAMKNRRKLEMIEFLDSKYIDEMFEDLKVPKREENSVRGRKAYFRSYRQIIAVAACALLLGALVPLVNYAIRYIPSFIAGIFDDTTDQIETNESTETDANLYEYPLSEEELAAVNSAWAMKKGDGSIFAESRESIKWWRDKICPTEYGDCVFAKYGGTIVLCRHSNITIKITREIIAEHELWFNHVCEIWVCHNSTYYTVQEAYEASILTKDKIAELEELQLEHNDEHRFDNYQAMNPTYLEFMENLEPLTEEEMIEIDKAYVQFCYDREFKAYLNRYSDLSKGEAEFGAYLSAKSVYITKRNKLFTKDYNYNRYYGIINDCVIFTSSDELSIKTYNLAGVEIYFPNATVMYIYTAGKVIPLRNAYFDGILTDEDIGEIANRHKLYNRFLNIDDSKPQITVEKTTPEYLEFDGIEPLTESEMYEIREAWAQYWYNNSYKTYYSIYSSMEYSDEELAHQKAIEELEGRYEETREELFNKNNYYSDRYYGKLGDCVILASKSMLAIVTKYIINGKEYLASDPGMFVYRGGEIVDIQEAYEKGWLTVEQVDEAFLRISKYNDALT